MTALERVWKQKLTDSGFVDLENEKGQLKVECQRNINLSSWEQSQTYFEIARDYLNTGTFRSETDKEVWSLFCDGFSLSENAARTNLTVDKVRTIVNRYKKASKLP